MCENCGKQTMFFFHQTIFKLLKFFSLLARCALLARCHRHCLDTFVIGWRDRRLPKGMPTSGPAFISVKLHSQLRPRYTTRYCLPTLSVVILTLFFGLYVTCADVVGRYCRYYTLRTWGDTTFESGDIRYCKPTKFFHIQYSFWRKNSAIWYNC